VARKVEITSFPSFREPASGWTMVGIDVIRATTTAITAVEAGRRVFPVASLEAAVPLAARLENPLLAGELGGSMPYGFHLQNSPVEMERPFELERPVILLSTTGTKLLCESAARGQTLAACLRNAAATAAWLIDRAHERVMLVAGESRGEFREEDRLCCARIAARLIEAGYEPESAFAEELVRAWRHAPDDAFVEGHSVQYLTATGQYHDVEYTLRHIDDLDAVYELRGGELFADRLALTAATR
jgi:2-phosphosulfolactate phosphatase